jgi:hypothetical protein
MAKNDFWHSDTEEEFNSGPFKTREEALADARVIYEEDEEFYIGREGEAKAEEAITADMLIDAMDEYLYEECGECADGIEANPKNRIALQEKVQKTIAEWFEQCGNRPTSFPIVEIEEVEPK